mmetsp:Transcript_17538/g.66308  ORF Transcript_17538/g.66308 Transcript_17538/m.66308 type:complete len:356 (+) Transcript_17538:621-1688(+)
MSPRRLRTRGASAGQGFGCGQRGRRHAHQRCLVAVRGEASPHDSQLCHFAALHADVKHAERPVGATRRADGGAVGAGRGQRRGAGEVARRVHGTRSPPAEAQAPATGDGVPPRNAGRQGSARVAGSGGEERPGVPEARVEEGEGGALAAGGQQGRVGGRAREHGRGVGQRNRGDGGLRRGRHGGGDGSAAARGRGPRGCGPHGVIARHIQKADSAHSRPRHEGSLAAHCAGGQRGAKRQRRQQPRGLEELAAAAAAATTTAAVPPGRGMPARKRGNGHMLDHEATPVVKPELACRYRQHSLRARVNPQHGRRVSPHRGLQAHAGQPVSAHPAQHVGLPQQLLHAIESHGGRALQH